MMLMDLATLASGFDLIGLFGKFLLGVALVIAVWFMALGAGKAAMSPPNAMGYYVALLACALGACWCFLTLFR